MIFQQLTLQNFGQYRGINDINLKTNKSKPILLLGGYNGGGKTTILEAMQLCLYGKRANGYRRSNQRWNEYLRSWINRDSDIDAKTKLKLIFQHPYENKETTFRIEFTWQSTGENIKEWKEVFINNNIDHSITATWDKFIDSILPAKLSTLFFFNGEQIENLVRPETAQQFLESAITELLGIGVIDQLQIDLNNLNRNKLLKNKPQEETQLLKDAENEYEILQDKVSKTEENLGMLRKQQNDERKHLEIIESEYESKGGKLLEEQALNEELKRELKRQLEVLTHEIIKEESGILPLFLVKDQLHLINTQAKKENDAVDCIQQRQQMNRLHSKYLDIAEKSGATNEVLKALSQLAVKENRKIDDKLNNIDIFLSLSANLTTLLETTLEKLPKTESKYKQLKDQRTQLEKQIEHIDALLAATPEKDVLKPLDAQRRNCIKTLSKIELEINSNIEILEELRNKLNLQKEKVISFVEESATTISRYENNQRIIRYSIKAQTYLEEFRKQILYKHIKSLETHILESFQHLMKKQSLVKNLEIELSSFSIILTNKEDQVIPAEKLSAGERQLLAIAIFWGLQKASKRSVPVIIDTPMGRLDSIHRDHLVRRYFPFAAHQVILLSTDEEIVGEYYNQLNKYTCKEFTIKYNEDNRSTQIKEGYFK